jgi:hypothetical protein
VPVIYIYKPATSPPLVLDSCIMSVRDFVSAFETSRTIRLMLLPLLLPPSLSSFLSCAADQTLIRVFFACSAAAAAADLVDADQSAAEGRLIDASVVLGGRKKDVTIVVLPFLCNAEKPLQLADLLPSTDSCRRRSGQRRRRLRGRRDSGCEVVELIRTGDVRQKKQQQSVSMEINGFWPPMPLAPIARRTHLPPPPPPPFSSSHPPTTDLFVNHLIRRRSRVAK